jgi:molecular chaperone GrpE
VSRKKKKESEQEEVEVAHEVNVVDGDSAGATEVVADETTQQPEGAEPDDGTVEAEEPDELSVAKQEADDFKDKWVRATAELDNFRRRMARERQEQFLRAADGVLKQLLTPMDNLARGLKTAREMPEPNSENEVTESADDAGTDGLLRGFEMVYEQFAAVLTKENVTVMETIGQPFDPMRHEAMMMVETEVPAPGTVVDEIERGYFHGERVLRHAKVVVSKAPAPPVEPEAADSTASADESQESGKTEKNDEAIESVE